MGKRRAKGAGSVARKATQTKRRKLESVDSNKPWLTLAHKKPSPDWVAYNPDTMRPPQLPSSTKFMKLLLWNVNGLHALMKKNDKFLTQLADEEHFDVICLTETKLQEKELEEISSSIVPPEYKHSFWNCSTATPGSGGTAIVSRVEPLAVKYGMGVSEHDKEGRVITAEFEDFYLVAGYVHDAWERLVRWGQKTDDRHPSLSQHMKELEKKKPVIYAGDMNCANDEIDISNPEGKSAGFTDEAREAFKTDFLENGFVDTFRHQHPKVVTYTYWPYRSGARARNSGWRVDYLLSSEGLMSQIYDSYVRPDVLGSDHCPVGLIVKLESD
ncbi:hypothetical protein R1flu_022530 [Riccia fluitans]|uniref:DNA repair nuclease/redox regulator APEX1 n=1 Tax=Riccia fluitans TaxID=41844 RepID=A0ABD1XPF9_9MARC